MARHQDQSTRLMFEDCMLAAPWFFGVQPYRGGRVAADVGGSQSMSSSFLDSLSAIDLSEETTPDVILSGAASFFIRLRAEVQPQLGLRWYCRP